MSPFHVLFSMGDLPCANGYVQAKHSIDSITSIRL